ncbi:MAG: flagellar biosynthetic protein FliR [Filomicrobium sp.]
MSEWVDYVIPTFVIFCRIGGCFMLVPGLSSGRIPVRFRVYIAVAVTLALAPIIVPDYLAAYGKVEGARLVELIINEALVGASIGLSVRVFMAALEFMGTAIAMFIGLGTLPGVSPADEPIPALASLISAIAVLLFFLLNLHLEVIRGLVLSFQFVPVGTFFDVQSGLERIALAFSQAFFLVLQISGPFVAYGLMINLLFGLVNKMVPQIPAYFVSIPFLIFGGLLAMYFLLPEMLQIFFQHFSRFIIEG